MIGYIVQSVPQRRELRQRLLEQLPPAVMIEDDGPPPGNPWRGYQLCLSRFLKEDWTHAVIVQDDALVCQNFAAGVERIARLFPENPVCLFYPGLKMHSSRNRQRAVTSGSSFFLLNRMDFMPVVSVLWPRACAEEIFSWSKNRKFPGLRPPYRSDDAICGLWARFCKRDVYVVMPSLVQHPDDVDPVKDGSHVAAYGADRGRVALSFHTGNALDVLGS